MRSCALVFLLASPLLGFQGKVAAEVAEGAAVPADVLWVVGTDEQTENPTQNAAPPMPADAEPLPPPSRYQPAEPKLHDKPGDDSAIQPSRRFPAEPHDPFSELFEYLQTNQAEEQQQLQRLRQYVERLERALEAQRAAKTMKDRQNAALEAPGPTLGDPQAPPDSTPAGPRRTVAPPEPARPVQPPGPPYAEPFERPSENPAADIPLDPAAAATDTAAIRNTEAAVDTPSRLRPLTTTTGKGGALPITDQAVDRSALADNLFGAGRIDLALGLYAELVDEVQDEDERLWYEFQLASCHRLRGERSEAAKYYRRVAGSAVDPELASHARWWLGSLEKQQKLASQLDALRRTMDKIEQELP